MKNKIIISCLFWLISICSFSQNTQLDSAKESILEDTLMNRIFKLPEIQNANTYIDSISKGKHGIAFLVQSTPTDSAPYYLIQVGYNGDLRFETYFNFYVYEKNLEIKYLDTTSDDDEAITLKEWREEEAKGINDWRSKK